MACHPNLAKVRFYEELNDFLEVEKRKVDFDYQFQGRPSVKDAIESLGVPHTEVDLILVNGSSVDFSYNLKNGDQISVYPVFEAIDIFPITHLRDAPLREVKFILDIHLGKLARLLRLLGFDSLYERDLTDTSIINCSLSESRIILSRDRSLLKCAAVTHGYCVHSIDPEKQVKEVLRRFDLHRSALPFSRCIECNGEIKPAEKEAIKTLLPGEAYKQYTEFFQCSYCQRAYWKGSHYKPMEETVARLLEED